MQQLVKVTLVVVLIGGLLLFYKNSLFEEPIIAIPLNEEKTTDNFLSGRRGDGSDPIAPSMVNNELSALDEETIYSITESTISEESIEMQQDAESRELSEMDLGGIDSFPTNFEEKGVLQQRAPETTDEEVTGDIVPKEGKEVYLNSEQEASLHSIIPEGSY